jgi:hypothetical protein
MRFGVEMEDDVKLGIRQRLFPDGHSRFGLAIPKSWCPSLPPEGRRLPDIPCSVADGVEIMLRDVVVRPGKEKGHVEVSFLVSQEDAVHFYPKAGAFSVGVKPKEAEDDGTP